MLARNRHLKQVKPRFTTTSRIITSMKKQKKLKISENSENFKRVSELSQYVKMFDKSLKLTQLNEDTMAKKQKSET